MSQRYINYLYTVSLLIQYHFLQKCLYPLLSSLNAISSILYPLYTVRYLHTVYPGHCSKSPYCSSAYFYIYPFSIRLLLQYCTLILCNVFLYPFVQDPVLQQYVLASCNHSVFYLLYTGSPACCFPFTLCICARRDDDVHQRMNANGLSPYDLFS
jgi:hypothetical protein